MRTRLLLIVLIASICFAPRFTIAAPTSQPAKPSIAVFRLDRPVTEAPDDSLALFGPNMVSFKEILERLKKAGDDPNVKAIVLFSEGTSLGAA
ncbi:MAG TPA: hypothetical protein VL282_07235, partial [Tepidisphaeraceae bacterium]|nr:hypothetical protein [Tepidisphaeraceae bacterium]